MHCKAVGTAYDRRYAYDSLRTNYVSKLSMFYERDLGITSAWNDTLRVGNPVRSDPVVQYMTFTREEQKKAGVLVKQAPALLDSHPKEISQGTTPRPYVLWKYWVMEGLI